MQTSGMTRKREQKYLDSIRAVVAAYKADVGTGEIAKQYQVNRATIVCWLKRSGDYKQHKTRYTPEEKSGIVSMYLSGSAIKTIASNFGIGVGSVTQVVHGLGHLRTQSQSQAVRAARDCVGFERFGKKGAVQSTKSGKWFACDSAYEFARMLQLDKDDDVIEWSRCTDRIPYLFGGIEFTYAPDLTVIRASVGVVVEEIKPNKFLRIGRNSVKFDAAIRFYKGLGITFSVVTEDVIGIKNIRILDGAPLSYTPDEARKEKRRKAALDHLRRMTPEERAIYNQKAKLRESNKRARDRDGYNRTVRMRRASTVVGTTVPLPLI